jgi:FixJ family two-component response regulator
MALRNDTGADGHADAGGRPRGGQELRRNFDAESLPIIAMTPTRSPPIAGIAAGMGDFISKPCDRRVLRDAALVSEDWQRQPDDATRSGRRPPCIRGHADCVH